MTSWIDTDYGFDDLWALLLLRAQQVEVDGVSLVMGNSPLPQVELNAMGGVEALGLDWPYYIGADKPLVRELATAQHVLGEKGMSSRGLELPQPEPKEPLPDAVSGLAAWLCDGRPEKTVLALGPLTNIALLLQTAPEAAAKITRLVWMGGSAGAGNFTDYAEFNAGADPEAVDVVMKSDLPLEVVDLELCHQVQYSERDIPSFVDTVRGNLLRDLMGGYLDIGLRQGRDLISIYDPSAALVLSCADLFESRPCAMRCVTKASIEAGDNEAEYGRTFFTPDPNSNKVLVTKADAAAALSLCIKALEQAAVE